MTPASNPSSESLRLIEQAEIDSSCRKSVIFFYFCAIGWLLMGTLFGFIASIKLHHPDFMSWCSVFTFGRIRPAHTNMMIYGWACCSAFGTGIWLLSHLCRAKLRRPTILLMAGVLWNLGVLVGCNGIITGSSTSVDWLEFPRYAGCLLLTAYLFIGSWVVMLFYDRKKENHVYISQWYILAAFFWFPWLYATAHFMLFIKPVSGVAQAIISGWFSQNLIGLWFGSIGVGSAYYLIPKLTGKPIHAYSLALPGFLSFALFYSWSGASHLVGAPIPVWIQSVSIVASVLMLIPVSIVGIQFFTTLREHFSAMKSSPVLAFVAFGAVSCVLAGLFSALTSFRSINAYLSFTHIKVAFSHMELYAFFSMIMFGAIYYIVPRLVSTDWPSLASIRMHFLSSSLGVTLMMFALVMAGLSQALDLDDAGVQFVATVAHNRGYMILRSVSGFLLAVAHITFAISFLRILLRACICSLKLGNNKTSSAS